MHGVGCVLHGEILAELNDSNCCDIRCSLHRTCLLTFRLLTRIVMSFVRWIFFNARKESAPGQVMTRVRLCFHDRCFDGTASAALFYRFYRERFDPKADFHFSGMAHRAVHPWEGGLFDGDENVIVDFKYSNSPKLTWWFDHHQSAFLTPEDAKHFREHPGPHMFYHPEYKSCTKLIATVAEEQFDFNTQPLAELIHWGEIIDGAQGGFGHRGDRIAQSVVLHGAMIPEPRARAADAIPPAVASTCCRNYTLVANFLLPGIKGRLPVYVEAG